jgi:hypothetical protein
MKKLITIVTLLTASGAFAVEPMPVFEFADPSAKIGRKAYQQNRIATHAAARLNAAKQKRIAYNQTHEHRMAVASAAWAAQYKPLSEGGQRPAVGKNAASATAEELFATKMATR